MYVIGNYTPISTAGNPTLTATGAAGIKIVCRQQFNMEAVFTLSDDLIEVKYGDKDDAVTLNWFYRTPGTYELELVAKKSNGYSSYLYFPNRVQPQDIFERAGVACGEIALSLSS